MREAKKQIQANRITLCCSSSSPPSSLCLLTSSLHFPSFTPSPHLSVSLSSARPWRHFTFTSHYTVWDDESAVYLSVSIQCCFLPPGEEETQRAHTHTHTLLSIRLSVPVSSLTHTRPLTRTYSRSVSIQVSFSASEDHVKWVQGRPRLLSSLSSHMTPVSLRNYSPHCLWCLIASHNNSSVQL